MFLLLIYLPRNFAANNGTKAIFQNDEILTFDEIANRWSGQQNGANGFSKEGVFDKLLNNFWHGLFEDKRGKSILSITYPISDSTFSCDNPKFIYEKNEFNRSGILKAILVFNDRNPDQVMRAKQNGESSENDDLEVAL